MKLAANVERNDPQRLTIEIVQQRGSAQQGSNDPAQAGILHRQLSSASSHSRMRSERPLKTLERVISKAGLGSRTDARRWIADGRVAVNGRVIRNPDEWVDPARAKVSFDSKPLRPGHKVY